MDMVLVVRLDQLDGFFIGSNPALQKYFQPICSILCHCVQPSLMSHIKAHLSFGICLVRIPTYSDRSMSFLPHLSVVFMFFTVLCLEI